MAVLARDPSTRLGVPTTCDRTGLCDLIGACSGAPSLSCPPRLAGACLPDNPTRGRHITMRQPDHDHDPDQEVFAGVDTHACTHHAAVVDALGRELGDREFPATSSGYGALAEWIGSFGL